MGSRPVFVNCKKAALDSQPQILKLNNFLLNAIYSNISAKSWQPFLDV
jgi:hypothetical protein